MQAAEKTAALWTWVVIQPGCHSAVLNSGLAELCILLLVAADCQKGWEAAGHPHGPRGTVWQQLLLLEVTHSCCSVTHSSDICHITSSSTHLEQFQFVSLHLCKHSCTILASPSPCKKMGILTFPSNRAMPSPRATVTSSEGTGAVPDSAAAKCREREGWLCATGLVLCCREASKGQHTNLAASQGQGQCQYRLNCH